MAVFKCKICGGALAIEEGMSVATCEYCGTKQTLPRLNDERRVNLFDRANHFRRNNDFDKAIRIYEQILEEDPTDAEVYWSLVLCRYGIEYVEDPVTHERIPTVNRVQYTSIFDDADYKAALQHADLYQRELYEQEALTINEIQKEILAISQKESPFDVFICYKETDEQGRRTRDSVLANDLYHQLTQEGYKVFFSRITLESKLGTAFEPYIFAALHSARVMVVIGTKPEFFNAVWVRNEWSRYLALIKAGENKALIPAYRDMDPYDLPEEFSHLQAQDMSKLGFMQDLIRGIRKLTLEDSAQRPAVEQAIGGQEVTNLHALLDRAFLFLEDGDWVSADQYCERVLDLDPRNAKAYLGKLMAELNVTNKAGLADCENPFDDQANYQKVMRFADAALKTELEGYIAHIRERNKKNSLDHIYREATSVKSRAKNEGDYKKAAFMFESIIGHEDAEQQVAECLRLAENARKDAIYESALEQMQSSNTGALEQAVARFSSIIGYKDTEQMLAECIRLAENARKDVIYDEALRLMQSSDTGELERAIEGFSSILGWRDSDQKSKECQAKIKEKRVILAKRQKTSRALTIAAISLVAVGIVFIAIRPSIARNIKYKNANEFLAQGQYSEAVTFLSLLGSYKDSPDKLKEGLYGKAKNLMVDGFSREASVIFTRLGDYEDAPVLAFHAQVAPPKSQPIGAGSSHTAGLKSDGTVIATGNNDDGQCDVEAWQDIVTISAGQNHTVGLKSDGAVIATGRNNYGQCVVEAWQDIVAVSAGNSHTVGLNSDGTVIATGDNDDGQCDVDDWQDIVAISAGFFHTVGLKFDGTLISVGNNFNGQCDVEVWQDIIAISTGRNHTVGLKSDGTVVATGANDNGQCDVEAWRDILAISTGRNHTVCLKSDGTVVATGSNDKGQCDVEAWQDIVAISAGTSHTVGLKSDGTAIVTGYSGERQLEVVEWKDIGRFNLR